jgi:hypothetical protein
MGPGDVSRETPPSDTAGKWRDQVERTFGTGKPPVTWRDYQDIVSHARHQYLAAVQRARELREQVTGPAFEAFAASERHAWFEYHETGHRAWLAYQEFQRATLQEPAPLATDPISALIDWAEAARPGTPSPLPRRVPPAEAGTPWPASPYDHPQPVFNPHPGNHGLSEFDQRQETYLAADPETRDNL